jgi:RNA ligase (TIGR02306 family)
MRKLATIRRVSKLEPIDGADRIEKATIDGWSCVVKKGEFKEGDFCVYFEIDSLLPIRDEYEFLRNSCYKKTSAQEGFRLRTCRFKGVVSQGLALPIDILPSEIKVEENSDVTEILGIQLYEPVEGAVLSGNAKGNFPNWIRKTDQERIENLFDKYSSIYRYEFFEVSIKLDGTSATYYHNNNLELKESEWNIEKKYNILALLKSYGKNIAIQGEIIGSGIQGNNEKLTDHRFFIFDIYDIDKRRYMTPGERHEALAEIMGFNYEREYNLEQVPILGSIKVFDMFNDIKALKEYSSGSSLNPASRREGLVFKSMSLIDGNTVSFKSISNEYLLKQKD